MCAPTTVQGTLKGYDALMNLVLDDGKETLRGTTNIFTPQSALTCKERELTCSARTDDEGNETTRALGLVVARGTLLVLISPVDGSEEIANPFAQPEDD
jgi:U6 snRNA-associated Sm-like protein LSm7